MENKPINTAINPVEIKKSRFKLKRLILPLLIMLAFAGIYFYLSSSQTLTNAFSRNVINNLHDGQTDKVYGKFTAPAKTAISKKDFELYVKNNFSKAKYDEIKQLSIENRDGKEFITYLVKKNGDVDKVDDYLVIISVKKSPYLINYKIDDIQFQKGKSL